MTFLAITTFIHTQVYVTINASNESLAIIFILNIAPITSSMLLSIFNFMSNIPSSHLRLWADFLSWWKLSNHTICYNPLEILLCLGYFIFYTSLWHWLNNLLINNEWVHNSYVNIVPKRPAVELSWTLSIIAIDSCFLIKRLFLVTIISGLPESIVESIITGFVSSHFTNDIPLQYRASISPLFNCFSDNIFFGSPLQLALTVSHT